MKICVNTAFRGPVFSLLRTECRILPLKENIRVRENAYFRIIYSVIVFKISNTADIYLLKCNYRNIRTRSKICSKLTIKIPERHHWRRSGIFIVNFEHISHLVLVFLLLSLNMYLPAGNEIKQSAK